MTVRPIAAVAGFAIVLGAAPALAASPGGNPETGPGTRPEVRPNRDVTPSAPPVAPELGDGVATPAPRTEEPERQAVLVQGYVKTARPDQLVLSAPGTPETLALAIQPETEVISPAGNVAVEQLKPGQLVRAALVPSGSELVALVVEVMPDAATMPGKPTPPAAPGESTTTPRR